MQIVGRIAVAALLSLALGKAGLAEEPAQAIPTGQVVTPTAASGSIFTTLDPELPDAPGFVAGQASALALSPDGRTLLILTSGFNRLNDATGAAIPSQSSEYVFVYDVSGPAPIKRQVLRVANTFLGLAWNPRRDRFYVSGGVDDRVLEFAPGKAGYAQSRVFPLGHRGGLGLVVKPAAAGLAVSPDGSRLLVANFQNDSVTLIELAAGVTRELELRPGMLSPARRGQPGGTFPRAVAWTSNSRAVVTSERDRELIALDVGRRTPRVAARLATRGQPVALTVNRSGSRLYAALDNSDSVVVVDPRRAKILETIATAGPPALLGSLARLGGAGSNALALTPDERALLVSNGGENAIAVVRLDSVATGGRTPRPKRRGEDEDDDRAPAAVRSQVMGLIPTGWYPTAVAIARDGRRIYAVNGKSNTGPNAGACRDGLALGPASRVCEAHNQYVWQLEKAGFLTLPTPTPTELGLLTRQVARNDGFPGARDYSNSEAVMGFLHRRIRHVIYVVKENRTYDQVLGDLEVGDGDPKLALFGRSITPNQHALARRFVDLDNFRDAGESSNTGWNWTTAARTNDFTEREAPVNYAGRGLQYDQEGTNRNINVAHATLAARKAANPDTPDDSDLLPGARDVAAPDGPAGESGRGYLWDAAMRARLSVRNWGFYGDLVRYDPPARPAQIPLEREPWKSGLRVFFPSNPSLLAISDPYYRGFDQAFPDYWRFREWAREFEGFEAKGEAPSLMLVRLPHDHTGAFDRAIDGLDTVETEVADNDYALGLLVEKVAHSRFASDTLIFVVEDDAQDGPDHVDAHRSVAFVAGPYVRQGAVVSRGYTTVNLVRTIGAVLGLPPLGLNDAMAEPMGDVFDIQASGAWAFDAKVPPVLRSTRLPLPPPTQAELGCLVRPKRPGAYWTAAMVRQDFSQEDRLDTAAYNLALWRGLKGDEPYPASRGGANLRDGRAERLARSSQACGD